MKTGQLIEQLKKSLEEKNTQVLLDLEKNLEREWKEMQERIEKNIQVQNESLLQQLTQSLQNIDWELEQCRTAKKWTWAIGGLIVGVILTIIALKIIKG